MQSREAIRTLFYEAWGKHKNKQDLTAEETLLAQLIEQHPDYIEIFDDEEKHLNTDFKTDGSEENPFLHLSFHHALLDQVGVDQPQGIRALYEQLVKKVGDAHEAEHQIMSILAHMIWEMLKSKKTFDHEDYLKEIQKLIR